MPQYIVYQYNPTTGFINATNSGSWDEDHAYLQLENQVASQEPLKDVDGNIVLSGWSFQMKDGAPAQPYVVTPPPVVIPPLSTSDHVFIAMVKSGQIDIRDVDAQILQNLNASLKAAGLPELGG